MLQRTLMAMICLIAVRAPNSPADVILKDGKVTYRINNSDFLYDFTVLAATPGWGAILAMSDYEEKTEGDTVSASWKLLHEGKGFKVKLMLVKKAKEAIANYEITALDDVSVNVVRLNGLLPQEETAAAYWSCVDGGTLKFRPFPRDFAGTGVMSAKACSSFSAFTKEGTGVGLEPLDGTARLTVQDCRTWRSKRFQICLILILDRDVKKGERIATAIRITPAKLSELSDKLFASGEPLLGVKFHIQRRNDANVGELSMHNFAPLQRALNASVSITDDIGTPLLEHEKQISIPPGETYSSRMDLRDVPGGHYRGRIMISDPAHNCREEIAILEDVDFAGQYRGAISLNGEWALRPMGVDDLVFPPPEDNWEIVRVPSRVFHLGHHRYWLKRSIQIPHEMSDKALFLRFTAVKHKAEVYLDGKPIGSHLGGYTPFELEITGLAKPGGTHELTLGVTDWTALSIKPVPADQPSEVGKKREMRALWKLGNCLLGPIGGGFYNCGITQSVQLLSRPKVHFSQVRLATSCRRKKLRVEGALAMEENEGTFHVIGEIHDRDGNVIPLPSLKVDASKSKTFTLEQKWENPHLWALEDPYLYRLVLRLERKGKILDQCSVRFGFREFWAKKGTFYLNGIPLHLPAASTGPRYDYDRHMIYKTIQDLLATHHRIMRLHTEPLSPLWLDYADELGMLIVDETALYVRCSSPCRPGDEAFWENVRRHVRELIERDGNHPSLVMYSMENELLQSSMKPKRGKDLPERARDWRNGLAELARYVRKLDPTRPITFEADLDVGGEADVLGLHYPHEYRWGHYLYPDEAYWFGGKVISDRMPYDWWKWKKNKPLYLGEVGNHFPDPDPHTLFLGEQSYVVEDPVRKCFAIAWQDEIAGYRYYDVSAYCPWNVLSPGPYPNVLWTAVEEPFRPVRLNVKESEKHFYEGQKVERTFTLYNDLYDPARHSFTVRWKLRNTDALASSDEYTVKLGPAEKDTRTVSLTTPRVNRKTEFVLEVKVEMDGENTFSDAFELIVHPRPGEAKWEHEPVLIYDPHRRIRKALAALRVPFRKMRHLHEVGAAKGTVLIDAKKARKELVKHRDALGSFVEAGGAAVVFDAEPDVKPPPSNYATYSRDGTAGIDYGMSQENRWLPFDAVADPLHSATMTFSACGSHPLVNGVDSDELKFWYPDHIVARVNYRKPPRGNFRPIIHAGGAEGLLWSPLLEMPHGKGRYVLCQMLLLGKYDTTPTAARILMNLLNFASAAKPRAWKALRVAGDPSGSFKGFLDELGVQEYSYAEDLGNLGADGLLLIDGSEKSWQVLQSQVDNVASFVKGGGTLWVRRSGPRQAELLTHLTGANIQFKAGSPSKTYIINEDNIIRGLSNHDLYWHEKPALDLRTPLRLTVDPELVATDDMKKLTLPLGLAVVSNGRGKILLDNFLWEETPSREAARRAVSILLTNLGVALRPESFHPPTQQAFLFIDILDHCNMAFRDEKEGNGKGGWTDQGEQDMRNLKPGMLRTPQAFFRIIDPEQGSSCIVLKGEAKPRFPASVRAISIDSKAKVIHVLHAAAWAGPHGSTIAQYVVNYADGTSISVPIRSGVEIADWWGTSDPTNAEVAWEGTSRENHPVRLFGYAWKNPYPHLEIRSVDLESTSTGVPIVLAISVESDYR